MVGSSSVCVDHVHVLLCKSEWWRLVCALSKNYIPLLYLKPICDGSLWHVPGRYRREGGGGF